MTIYAIVLYIAVIIASLLQYLRHRIYGHHDCVPYEPDDEPRAGRVVVLAQLDAVVPLAAVEGLADETLGGVVGHKVLQGVFLLP